MTQAEKLEALVKYAVGNGVFGIVDREQMLRMSISHNGAGSVSLKIFAQSGALRYSNQFSLFNHDFARALFGEELYIAYQYHKTLVSGLNVTRDPKDLIEQGAMYAWRYHLQQAVISEDPIDYVYRAVFGE